MYQPHDPYQHYYSEGHMTSHYPSPFHQSTMYPMPTPMYMPMYYPDMMPPSMHYPMQYPPAMPQGENPDKIKQEYEDILSGRESEIKTLQRQIEKLKFDMKDMELRARYGDDREAVLNDLRTEKMEYENKLNRIGLELDNTKSAISAIREGAGDNAGKLFDLEEKIGDLEIQAEELERQFSNEISTKKSLDRQLQDERQRIKEIENELREHQSRISQLELKLNAARSMKSDPRNMGTDELVQQVNNLTGILNGLRQQKVVREEPKDDDFDDFIYGRSKTIGDEEYNRGRRSREPYEEPIDYRRGRSREALRERQRDVYEEPREVRRGKSREAYLDPGPRARDSYVEPAPRERMEVNREEPRSVRERERRRDPYVDTAWDSSKDFWMEPAGARKEEQIGIPRHYKSNQSQSVETALFWDEHPNRQPAPVNQQAVDQKKRETIIENLESNLMQLQMEKKRLDGELSRIPNSKTAAQRRREGELELELDIVNTNISNIKSKLLNLNALKQQHNIYNAQINQLITKMSQQLKYFYKDNQFRMQRILAAFNDNLLDVYDKFSSMKQIFNI